jgi:hypothetical protein
MATQKETSVAIVRPANIVTAEFAIIGTAPLVQHRFWKKGSLMADMATAKADKPTKKQKPPRDYDAEFTAAQHVSTAGWCGIPAPAFRSAMIDACRTVGLVMTTSKMAVFILPDGFDAADGTPLVRIIADDPERHEAAVRNADGSVDIRIRPMWRTWAANVTVEFDADMISAESVVNLLDRAGRQVGIGEGRPYSKKSVGQGWGTFKVVTDE